MIASDFMFVIATIFIAQSLTPFASWACGAMFFIAAVIVYLKERRENSKHD